MFEIYIELSIVRYFFKMTAKNMERELNAQFFPSKKS
jgi:hypothetical protein